MRITTDFFRENIGFVCEDHLSNKFFLYRTNKDIRVMNEKMTLHANGVKSYEQEAVFRNENFVLGNYMKPLMVSGYKIYPVFAGSTALIDGGIRIYFHILT